MTPPLFYISEEPNTSALYLQSNLSNLEKEAVENGFVLPYSFSEFKGMEIQIYEALAKDQYIKKTGNKGIIQWDQIGSREEFMANFNPQNLALSSNNKLHIWEILVSAQDVNPAELSAKYLLLIQESLKNSGGSLELAQILVKEYAARMILLYKKAYQKNDAAKMQSIIENLRIYLSWYFPVTTGVAIITNPSDKDKLELFIAFRTKGVVVDETSGKIITCDIAVHDYLVELKKMQTLAKEAIDWRKAVLERTAPYHSQIAYFHQTHWRSIPIIIDPKTLNPEDAFNPTLPENAALIADLYQDFTQLAEDEQNVFVSLSEDNTLLSQQALLEMAIAYQSRKANSLAALAYLDTPENTALIEELWKDFEELNEQEQDRIVALSTDMEEGIRQAKVALILTALEHKSKKIESGTFESSNMADIKKALHTQNERIKAKRHRAQQVCNFLDSDSYTLDEERVFSLMFFVGSNEIDFSIEDTEGNQIDYFVL